MSKKLLITVHGINSTGEWQDTVVGALSDHFACESVKYPDYRPLGFFRNCFSLWIFPMMAVSAAIFIYWSHLAGYFAGGAAILGAFFLAARKRQKSVKAFASAYQNAVNAHHDPRPHAIAHSFGTYLLCSSLQKFPDTVSFDRMVLFGSVVDRHFPWDEVKANQGVQKVRNEMGYRDWAVRLAGLAVWVKGMGTSGVRGFSRGGGILDQRNYGEFGHSDAPTLRKRIQEVWLPFFWGIPIEDYRTLLNVCAECLRRTTPSNQIGDVDGFPKFDKRRWSWSRVRGRQTAFKPFMQAAIGAFFERRGAASFVGSPLFEMAYPIARHLFWQSCVKHDGHPFTIALAAAEEATDFVTGRFV